MILSNRTVHLEWPFDGSAVQNCLEQRIAWHCHFAEAEMRDRPLVEAIGGGPIGKSRDLGPVTPLCRCDAGDFQKTAEANRDLAIEGIGHGETPAQIAGDDGLRIANQLDLPGLAVVRVGREDGMAESEKPHIIRLRALRNPGCQGCRGRAKDAVGAANADQKHCPASTEKNISFGEKHEYHPLI